jgi:aerobic-type carbon monoxide dehydrogenase small subunit (CoxS/CutS family)
MADDRTSTGSAPRSEDGPDTGVSRRLFLQSLGVSAAAAPLTRAADAARPGPAATDAVAILGPDPVGITLRVNGKQYEATVDPATTLLEALRIDLDLTGTKAICDRGACGGCSVLMDGRLMASCMTLAIDAIGTDITTVEGLAKGETLDPVQEAFVRHDALQCGYCTPGMIMAARALLNENPKPTPGEIKHGLSGNLCRCGTYGNVVNAVLDASGQMPIRDGGGG